MKIVHEFRFHLAKNTPPPPTNENCSGLCIWPCQEYPLPKMKIVKDFGFELAKNTHPLKMKIVKLFKTLDLSLPRITATTWKWKLFMTLDLRLPRIPPGKWKLFMTWDLRLPRIPLESENFSGLWIWGCQEYPSPPKWKLFRTLDFTLPRIPQPHP